MPIAALEELEVEGSLQSSSHLHLGVDLGLANVAADGAADALRVSVVACRAQRHNILFIH